MKKLQYVLAAALFVGSTTVAVAQDAPARQQGQRPNQMAMLMEGITLTADQQPKVDSLAKKYDAERAKLRDPNANLDREARMAKSRELMTKQLDELKLILTDDQKKCLEANVTAMQARQQQGGGRPPQR
jgi:hypothetical protein